MGCVLSHSQNGQLAAPGVSTYSNASASFNENAVDSSHFSCEQVVYGIGGFGMVRAAKKISGDDKGACYAIKCMSKSEVLKRSSELDSLVILKGCGFVCDIFYAFQDSTHLYAVLDVAEGGDMRFNLRATPNLQYSESTVKFFAAQLILALNYCHSKHILHRDIKPENIIMDKSGYLKLIDFGVAKILPNIEDCRSTSGTHGYMAPEIYKSNHTHGTPADWFALGITLHEFLCGRRPFETARLQAFRFESNEDTLYPSYLYAKCEYLSEDCRDFVSSLLQPEVHRRIGTQDGMKEISGHPWIKNEDWLQIEQKSFSSPEIPDLSTMRNSLRSEDIRLAIQAYVSAEPVAPEKHKLFQKYEYRTGGEQKGPMREEMKALDEMKPYKVYYDVSASSTSSNMSPDKIQKLEEGK